MSPMHRVTKYIGHQEVRAGLRLPRSTTTDSVRFAITAVCDSSEPEKWHGEVSFAGRLLISTPVVDSHDKAGHDAEAALTAKIVHVFSD
jgi:hypothetical protein